jgi:Saxitoxin biosynthesis operon protein SxtJ
MATVLEPNLARSPVSESSDRSFGFVFAALFTIIGCWPLLRQESPRWWAFVIAAAFVLLAVIRPDFLHTLNRTWLAFGRLLHQVVNPLVLGAIFFLCVTPIAWLIRRRGKDMLSLARRADLPSYWITREPSAPATVSMKRQF